MRSESPLRVLEELEEARVGDADLVEVAEVENTVLHPLDSPNRPREREE